MAAAGLGAGLHLLPLPITHDGMVRIHGQSMEHVLGEDDKIHRWVVPSRLADQFYNPFCLLGQILWRLDDGQLKLDQANYNPIL